MKCSSLTILTILVEEKIWGGVHSMSLLINSAVAHDSMLFNSSYHCDYACVDDENDNDVLCAVTGPTLCRGRQKSTPDKC